MLEASIRDRLNCMMAAGHPVFVFGKTVVFPVEAEDYFRSEEMDELERYILSSC